MVRMFWDMQWKAVSISRLHNVHISGFFVYKNVKTSLITRSFLHWTAPSMVNNSTCSMFGVCWSRNQLTHEPWPRVKIFEHFMGEKDLSRIKSSPSCPGRGRLNSTQVSSPIKCSKISTQGEIRFTFIERHL